MIAIQVYLEGKRFLGKTKVFGYGRQGFAQVKMQIWLGQNHINCM